MYVIALGIATLVTTLVVVALAVCAWRLVLTKPPLRTRRRPRRVKAGGCYCRGGRVRLLPSSRRGVSTRDEAIRRFATVRRPRGVWRRVVGAVLVVAATACAVRCRTTLGVVMVAAGVAVLRAVALGIVFFFFFSYGGHKEWRTTKRGQGEEAECAQVARHAALGGAKWNGSGAGGADYRFDEADIEEAIAASLQTASPPPPRAGDETPLEDKIGFEQSGAGGGDEPMAGTGWRDPRNFDLEEAKRQSNESARPILVLLRLTGYDLHDVRGDGNCLFRAVASSLLSIDDNSDEALFYVLLLRRMAIRGVRTLSRGVDRARLDDFLKQCEACIVAAAKSSGQIDGSRRATAGATRIGNPVFKEWACGMAGNSAMWGDQMCMKALAYITGRPVVCSSKLRGDAGTLGYRSYDTFGGESQVALVGIDPDAAFVAYNGTNHYLAYTATSLRQRAHDRASLLGQSNKWTSLCHVVVLCGPVLLMTIGREPSRRPSTKRVVDYLVNGIPTANDANFEEIMSPLGDNLGARWDAFLRTFLHDMAPFYDGPHKPVSIEAVRLRSGKLQLQGHVDPAPNVLVVVCAALKQTSDLPREAQLTSTSGEPALSHVGFGVKRPARPFVSSDRRKNLAGNEPVLDSDVDGSWYVLAGTVHENGYCVTHPHRTDAIEEPRSLVPAKARRRPSPSTCVDTAS